MNEDIEKYLLTLDDDNIHSYWVTEKEIAQMVLKDFISFLKENEGK